MRISDWSSDVCSSDLVLLDQVRKLGIVEGALAGLVDHRLAGNGIEFGYDVVARLADHEDAAHRAEIADRHGAASAGLLGLVQIAQIGLVPFAGVHDQQDRKSTRLNSSY